MVQERGFRGGKPYAQELKEAIERAPQQAEYLNRGNAGIQVEKSEN